MKKLTVLLAAVLMLAACGKTEESVKGTGESAKNDKGDYATAEIELQGDKVVSISLDEIKDGKSKKELGSKYGMKNAGASKIKKEWDEQVKFLEDYIVKNGLDKVELTAEGKAKNDDVLAGCTINLTSMMEAANAAKVDADK